MKRDLFNRNQIDEDLYKIRKVPYHKDDMHQLKELLNHANYSNYSKHNTGSSYGKGSRKPKINITDQRVTFKMSYSKTMTSHKKYVQNYMVQKDKEEVDEKPTLYGTDLEIYEEHMDKVNFKCIISPENQNVDLKVLSKEFIKRLEKLTGYKFYWVGAIHNNTAHKHAHLCINGVDETGKKVQFQKEWIRNTMREMLSYITTQMIGERTVNEIEAAKKLLPQAKRWTLLDEELEKQPRNINIKFLEPEVQNRLMFLNEINLAKKIDKNHYTLDTLHKEVLQATGRYNTFLENYMELNHNLRLYSGEAVRGTVIKVITFDKDEAWNDAIIIHTKDNKNVYVPVWQLQKEDILGREVKIKGNKETLGRQISDKDILINKRKNIDKGINRSN